jgi:hypothetical protein
MSEEGLQEAPKIARASFIETLLSCKAGELGTLAFNLCACAWVGLNVTFLQGKMLYIPGCFVHPNLINLASGCVLIIGTILATVAIRRGSLLTPAIGLTFTWSFLATLYRAAMGQ